MKNEDELMNKIFFKKYQILKKIGCGSFGSVYLGKNITTEQLYAVKFEPKNQQDLILERESYLLYYLRGFGIPQIITYGHNSKYNILVQTLLGKSINRIFQKNDFKLSLKDCCMIGIQLLDRLEYIHSKYIIHRDVKPDNFLIGNPDSNIIYIIDFGLAKKFMSSRTGKHAKFSINKKWSGTSRFASANSLRGVSQSRRDDLESLCYLLLYLMKGSLPWDNVNSDNENEEILLIYKIKRFMKPELLFLNLPKETAEFFSYCKKLEYEQKPDYNYLRNLLLNSLEYSNEKNDLNFSWINQNDIDLYSYNIDNNKFNRIIKRKNSPRQNLYNSLIDKRINSEKRSESFNKDNKNDKFENKVKKDCQIIKYISPNLKNIKINNLFKNDKIQKYKYTKKIPNGKRKIIIQTNNLNKNSVTKFLNQTQNECVKKENVNIIPLKNISKFNKDSKIKNNNENKVIKEKKIFFKKLNICPKEKSNTFDIRKNNSFNFKNNKINLLNYISSNNINEHYKPIGLNKYYNINHKTKININNIKKNKSLTNDNNYKYYKSINFIDSLNNNHDNLLEIKSVNTYNDNLLSYQRNNLKKINRNLDYINNNYNSYHNSLQPVTQNELNSKRREYLNLFNRNDENNLKGNEKISYTNNNINNNYNINIDLNNTNNKDNKNKKYKNIKDIKIINIISPINKNTFYHKVKKNCLKTKIPQSNRIIKKTINKNEIKEIFNQFFGDNNKNDIFGNYYSNAEKMKRYKKIKNSVIKNGDIFRYENSWDGRYKLNINKNNSGFVKEDIYSYNFNNRNSHNCFGRYNTYKYVSPKSVEKYKSKFYGIQN